jgi:hypothetical protein
MSAAIARTYVQGTQHPKVLHCPCRKLCMILQESAIVLPPKLH